jgi:hypothetical protein
MEPTSAPGNASICPSLVYSTNGPLSSYALFLPQSSHHPTECDTYRATSLCLCPAGCYEENGGKADVAPVFSKSSRDRGPEAGA